MCLVFQQEKLQGHSSGMIRWLSEWVDGTQAAVKDVAAAGMRHVWYSCSFESLAWSELVD